MTAWEHGGRLPVGADASMKSGADVSGARPGENGDTTGKSIEERPGPRPLTDAEWDASIWRSLAGLRDWPPLEIDYHTVSAALDERIALRAAVARLEGERERVAAERDAARAALAALISDAEIAWHDYHNLARHTGRREGCDLEICRGLRRAVARARAASDGGER